MSFRDELQQAAGGVAAEQRALWAAQRLCARHVVNREAHHRRRGNIDFIEIDGVRRFLMLRIVDL